MSVQGLLSENSVTWRDISSMTCANSAAIDGPLTIRRGGVNTCRSSDAAYFRADYLCLSCRSSVLGQGVKGREPSMLDRIIRYNYLIGVR